ncbi:MAG: MFS transporter [Chloroflexi bacterium]|nr:MFS transporter [Chloroflexota bacterium]
MTQHVTSLPPHYHRNFGLFLTDFICFMVGMNFINANTVVPAFVRSLTDSAPLIGLGGTLFSAGWLLPQLPAARLMNDKLYKRPYMLIGMSGRGLFLPVALALVLGLARYPGITLALFFVCLALFAAGDGFSGVAWYDILARAVPLKRRGRLIGAGQIVTGLAGIGAGAFIGRVMSDPRFPYPRNYALFFALASVLFIPSTIALILIREPPPPQSPDSSQHKSSRENWLQFLQDDPGYRRMIVCRVLVSMASLAIPFYVGHASDVLHLPRAILGAFIVAQTVGGMLSSVLLSIIAERRGPRRVAQIGSAVAASAPILALSIHLTGTNSAMWVYPLIFVALGAANSAQMLGFSNYVLEIAPDTHRPAYLGLCNTILGITTLIPTLGGWLLELTSYGLLFGLTAALVCAGFVYTLGLPQPERAG